MPLRIDNFTPTKLLSLNVRTENHGDGLQRAVDLKCLLALPNTSLDQLDPALLDMIFKPVPVDGDAGQATQTELDGVAPITSKPLLRSHRIKFPMALDVEYSGYQLTVDRGLGGSSNLTLLEVMLNKVTVNCKEGGTVEIGFRLQISNVGDEVIGRLSSYIKSDMHIALLPPEMKQEAIDGSTEAFNKDHPEATTAAPAPAPTGHEAGDTLAANEAAGLNKPASEVPKPKPARKKAKQPSLAVVD